MQRGCQPYPENKATALLVYRGYDTKEIIDYAKGHGMEIVIPRSATAKSKEITINICTSCVI